MRTLVREQWDGEDIVKEADEDTRRRVVGIIQQKTAQTIEQHRDADWLASELKHATGDWARNWGRIARTELQGAYVEGVVIDAIRQEGAGARIARIPEPGACEHCRRVFLDEQGRPRIFTAEELVNNGTNVGRKAADWRATTWPVHPNCACDVQVVPPGMEFDAKGRLVRA